MEHIASQEYEGGRAFVRWREEFFEKLSEAYKEVVEGLEAIFLAYFPLAVASELQNKDEIKTTEKKVEKDGET